MPQVRTAASHALLPGVGKVLAMACPQRQTGCDSRWNGLRKHFHP